MVSVRWAVPLAGAVLVAAPATTRAADRCAIQEPHDARILNPYWESLDANGLPLNPRFQIQQDQRLDGEPLCLADPRDRRTCGGFPVADLPGQPDPGVPYGDPKCTDFATGEYPWGWHFFTCSAGKVPFHTGEFTGHINWLPATYHGLVLFREKAGGDKDVNFELLPVERGPGGAWRAPRPAMATANKLSSRLGTDRDTWAALTAARLNYTLHSEMNARESLDRFTQKWWTDFRSEIARDRDQARRRVSGLPAVATGLLGLDAEHEGHTELHPIYSLAIQTRCATAPETQGPHKGSFVDEWAVILRTSGNAGWCSAWVQEHELALPRPAFAWSFPSVLAGTAAAVSRVGYDLRADRDGVQVAEPRVVGGDVQLAVTWPGTSGIRLHGTVTLAVKPTAGASPRRCPRLQDLVPAGPGPVSAGPEAAVEGPADARGGFVERLQAVMPQDRQQVEAAPHPSDDRPVAIGTVPAPAPPGGPGRCPGNVEPCSDSLQARIADRLGALPEVTAEGEFPEWSERKAFCDRAWDVWKRGIFQDEDRTRLQALLRMQCR